jgi:uncharacterized protein (DUF488 family)
VPSLWTAGYERHPTPESLIAALRAACIERVIDVRDLPLSRRRGFSKTALGEALTAAGIAYEHRRALGNPKELRTLYRSGRAAEGRAAFVEHLRATGSDALADLAGSLGAVRTCLLCLEHDPLRCHREVVVEELRARVPGLAVEHL